MVVDSRTGGARPAQRHYWTTISIRLPVCLSRNALCSGSGKITSTAVVHAGAF